MNKGIDIGQLRKYVVQPTLDAIGLHVRAAENLVLGTALVESRAVYLHQLGRGPAQGIFQMEPATEKDIWDNYLKYKPELANKVKALCADVSPTPDLIGNLYYAAAMCRVHYRRVREPLPGHLDAYGMATYWKKYYNTPLGAGTVQKALPYFEIACS